MEWVDTHGTQEMLGAPCWAMERLFSRAKTRRSPALEMTAGHSE